MCPRMLSTPFHKYDNVCGWGLRGEVAKRGGGDAGTSATTRDKEIARNPYPPEGLERDGPISLLLLLADVPASTRRRASIWAPPLPTNVIVFMKVSTKERSRQGPQLFRGGCSDPIQRAGMSHRFPSRSGVGASRWLATSDSPERLGLYPLVVRGSQSRGLSAHGAR